MENKNPGEKRNIGDHPAGVLSRILHSGLFRTAVLGFAGFLVCENIDLDAVFPDNQSSALHILKNRAIGIAPMFRSAIPLLRGDTIGPKSSMASLQGKTIQTGAFDGEDPEPVVVIQASALQPGKSYYSPQAAHIIGDLKNVRIIASERLIVQGNVQNSILNVVHVPFGCDSYSGVVGGKPGTVVGNCTMTYGAQPGLVVTGMATYSKLTVDGGNIHVGTNNGSKIYTENDVTTGPGWEDTSPAEIYTNVVNGEVDSSSRTIRSVAGQKVEMGPNGMTIHNGDGSVVKMDSGGITVNGTNITDYTDGSRTIITQGKSGTSVRTVIAPHP